MKNIKLTAILLALASATLISTSAKAVTTDSPGDILLGVEDQNGNVTNDYEVDLGSYTIFANDDKADASGTTVLVGALGLDLSHVFGANYLTAATAVSGGTDIAFGLYGTSTNVAGATALPTDTIFLSDPEATPGTFNTATSDNPTFTEKSGSSQGATEAQIAAAETGPTFSGFSGQSTTGFTGATTNSGDATQVAASGSNSYSTREAHQLGVDSGFGTSDADLNDFSGDLSGSGVAGVTGAVSDLDVLEPSTTGASAIVLGSFQFDSAGNLYFTTDSAGASLATTPEPSTYALLVAGSLLLVWQLRRRSAFNA